MRRDAAALAVVVLVTLVVCALIVARPWRDAVNWEDEQKAYFTARRAIGAPLDQKDEVLGVREIATRWKSDGKDSEEKSVDRCTSCHLGVDDPKMARDDVPRELRAHPQAILASHPIERFGCTSCHGGDGTDVTMRAHARPPKSASDPNVEAPDAGPTNATNATTLARGALAVKDDEMRAFTDALPQEESRCVACHAREPSLLIDGHESAPLIARGKTLFRELSCNACHEGAPGDARVSWSAPLDDVSAKMKTPWMLAFIRDPRSLRARSTMPSAWPEPIDAKTGAPFAADSTEHAAWLANMKSESLSIAAFLLAESERDHIGSHTPNAAPKLSEKIDRWAAVPGANAEEGAALTTALGCVACHAIAGDDGNAEKQAEKQDHPAHAPSLANAGDALTTSWLAWYLEDPTRAASHGRMPSSRLNRREAASIAMYLATLHEAGARGDADKEDTATLADAAHRNERVRCNVGPGAEMGRAECGERLYVKYGCGNCHSLEAYSPEKRAAPSLAGLASKPDSARAFGASLPDAQSLTSWIARKLDAPRELPATSDATMPDYDLDREEIAALTVYLAGFTNDVPQPRFDPAVHDGRVDTWRGEALIRDLACAACHAGKEGAPSLVNEGDRVRPEWLFSFLRDPGAHGVRPALHPEWIWGNLPPTDRLEQRMPTFALTVSETTTIVHTLSEGRGFPYSDPQTRKLAPDEKLKAITWMNKAAPDGGGCFDCHFAGELPKDRAKVDPLKLAPNLDLVRERLRPDWVLAALVDPESALPNAHGEGFHVPSPADAKLARDFLFGLDPHSKLPRAGEENRVPLF